jgi:hypothetical protein
MDSAAFMRGERMSPISEINEDALHELYERAESYRQQSEKDTKEGHYNSGLTYAALYQAENLRIANFLKELEMTQKRAGG